MTMRRFGVPFNCVLTVTGALFIVATVAFGCNHSQRDAVVAAEESRSILVEQPLGLLAVNDSIDGSSTVDHDTVKRLSDSPLHSPTSSPTNSSSKNTIPVASPESDRSPSPVTFGIAKMVAKSSSKVRGTVKFISERDATGEGSTILIHVNIAGASPGKHGFHLHENGDCSGIAAAAAGRHWNPTGEPHGGPTNPTRHLGDLGNLTVGADGKGVETLRVTFPRDQRGDVRTILIGKSVVIHQRTDDFASQPSGNSGPAIACGVVELTDVVAH